MLVERVSFEGRLLVGFETFVDIDKRLNTSVTHPPPASPFLPLFIF